MADGITLNSGSGGDTLAADDVGGTKYPRSKLIHGADGVNDGDVAKTNPLPVGFNTVKDGSGALYAPLVDADGHQQVDVVAALPAGTNAIGKLAANSGVDIGDVDVLSIAAGDNNIGNVDIVTVPADPFGANADAASATGSISAKLRFIASTGIPITGTVTVGSHAVTNAGTFAVQADSVIPGTGATNLGKAEDAAHASGDVGVMALAIRKATPAAVSDTDGDYEPLQVNAGRLWVSAIVDTALPTGANTIGAVAQSGTWNIGTVTTVTTCSTVTTITNAVKSVGNTPHDDALSDAPVCIGGFAKAAAPTSVSTDGDAVRAWFALNGAQFVVLVGADGQQSGVLSHGAQKVGGDWEHLDDSAFTPAGARVAMVGFFADETSTDSVNEGDGGAARMTLDRKQIVTDYAHTAGGLTPHKTVSAATTNATNVKGSAGQLYEIVCTNINAAVRYLKLYDKATAPTVGTDTPVWTLAIPGNTAGAGLAKTIPKGLTFANGIGFALTTGVADSDTGAVAANELVVNLGYK